MKIRNLLKLVILLPLSACGATTNTEWQQIMNDLNHKGNNLQECQYQAPLTTQQYDGFSISLKMPCNLWQAKISNQSEYEIRCDMNGYIHTAKPNTETPWQGIGPGTQPTVSCAIYNGPVRATTTFDNYVVQEQLVDGEYFQRLKNTRDYKQRCQIKDKNRQVIDTFDLKASETSIWVSVNRLGYTSCRRAIY